MLWEFHGHPAEVILYFSVYLTYLIYGLWVLITSREKILSISKFGFSNGWPWLGNHKDDTNDELENFSQYIADNWYWYLLHLGLCTLSKMWSSRALSLIFSLFSIVYLSATMHLLSIVTYSILLITFYMISTLESKRLIWLSAAMWMAAIHVIKNSQYFYALEYMEYFTLIQLLSWTVLRGCSFALQRIAASNGSTAPPFQPKMYSFVYFLGYTLYFPCLIYGPFMGYHRYKAVEEQKQFQYNWKLLLWEMLRVLIWWLLLQISSHYLYLHYMARDITALKVVDTVYGLHAIGYFMGQYFFVFYVITYGLGIAFARYDGLIPTNKPRCIGRIHFYSDMWKYFDEGLYEFLFNHIYCELCGKRSSVTRKIFATLTTFAFVFVWHGCHSFVLIWSILNFGCLVVEKIFKYLILSGPYKHFTRNILQLGCNGLQRLNALLATQIFIPAAFSNVFFISGQDVGEYLMCGAYQNGWFNYIILTFCSYCFFQCSQIMLQMKK